MVTTASSVSEDPCSSTRQADYYRFGEQQASHDLERVLPVARKSRNGREICLEFYCQLPITNLQLDGPTLSQYARFVRGYRVAFKRLVREACRVGDVPLPRLERVPRHLIVRAA